MQSESNYYALHIFTSIKLFIYIFTNIESLQKNKFIMFSLKRPTLNLSKKSRPGQQQRLGTRGQPSPVAVSKVYTTPQPLQRRF